MENQLKEAQSSGALLIMATEHNNLQAMRSATVLIHAFLI